MQKSLDKFSIYPKLQIGFQNRQGTFTNKLAYIVRANDDGSLREVHSWENWRDKKIDPLFIDNTPLSGFVLNKGHTRHNYSHFGNGKTSVIRVHDPREFEFEITCENLVFILMHTDCNRRELKGEFVYVFDNRGKVFLLPICCEEYKNSSIFTNLKNTNFSLKDLKKGATYKTKTLDEVIYIGQMRWFEFEPEKKSQRYYDQNWTRKSRNKHIFYTGKKFKPLTGKDIGACISEECDSNYSNLVESYENSIHFNSVKEFKYVSKGLIDVEKLVATRNYQPKFSYNKKDHIYYRYNYRWSYSRDLEKEFANKYGVIKIIDLSNGILNIFGSSSYTYSSGDGKILSKKELSETEIITLYCVLENGTEVKFLDLFK